jgi:glycosyltransferase involved in cell wall biosynthesis
MDVLDAFPPTAARAMMWHILTGEYPPQRGGVSTYTRQIARGLAAAGDQVTVWAPPIGQADRLDAGIDVRRLPDTFGRRSRRLLDVELHGKTSRLLVQYVPHAFGWKGANVPFCRWLASGPHDRIWVMFHEVAFPFDARQSLMRNALAAANRVMARLVARSAERAFISIPGWRPMLPPLASPDATITWLPVPSGIDVVADRARVEQLRARFGDGQPIVGHFGTYPASIRGLLADTIRLVAAKSACRVLLIGPRGEQLRDALVASDASLGTRVFATGGLPGAEVSAHIAVCDVMVQPYPDGISTRRTSAMAALAHGVAVVSTSGWLTESLWQSADAVALAPVDDPVSLARKIGELLASADARARVGAAGRQLYDARFDVRHTIAILRDAASPSASRVCA